MGAAAVMAKVARGQGSWAGQRGAGGKAYVEPWRNQPAILGDEKIGVAC